MIGCRKIAAPWAGAASSSRFRLRPPSRNFQRHQPSQSRLKRPPCSAQLISDKSHSFDSNPRLRGRPHHPNQNELRHPPSAVDAHPSQGKPRQPRPPALCFDYKLANKRSVGRFSQGMCIALDLSPVDTAVVVLGASKSICSWCDFEPPPGALRQAKRKREKKEH